MNITKKSFFMILIINLAITTQASELPRHITFDESRNAELQYDLGSEYYLAQKNNLKRLAKSLKQDPLQYFQDLSQEEKIAHNNKAKISILLSKMSQEQKVAWTAQKIRFKLLKKKQINRSDKAESISNKKFKTS